jgi:hypothetical protein
MPAESLLLILLQQQVSILQITARADLVLTQIPAAAAARINAQIQAKKGIQHVDVPPIRAVLSSGDAKSASPAPTTSTSTVNGEIYIADGDYIKDIEINDLRNRYTLTKGSTQKEVNTYLCQDPLITQAFGERLIKSIGYKALRFPSTLTYFRLLWRVSGLLRGYSTRSTHLIGSC